MTTHGVRIQLLCTVIEMIAVLMISAVKLTLGNKIINVVVIIAPHGEKVLISKWLTLSRWLNHVGHYSLVSHAYPHASVVL